MLNQIQAEFASENAAVEEVFDIMATCDYADQVLADEASLILGFLNAVEDMAEETADISKGLGFNFLSPTLEAADPDDVLDEVEEELPHEDRPDDNENFDETETIDPEEQADAEIEANAGKGEEDPESLAEKVDAELGEDGGEVDAVDEEWDFTSCFASEDDECEEEDLDDLDDLEDITEEDVESLFDWT